MKYSIKIIFPVFFFLLLFACEKLDLEKEVPRCIEQKIEQIKKEEVRSPPASVWEWEVDGKIYYYITSDCCDQFNFLYDKNCNEICAPDGGFSGMGDGKCPDFNGPIKEMLIWEDDRG